MSIPTILATSFSHVMFKSSLNLMDRILFSKKILGFFHLVFLASAIPLVMGCLALLYMGELRSVMGPFLTYPCFFLSLTTYLAGLTFSYSLRQHPVRHVILRAKLPELILPFLLLLPWYSQDTMDFKTWIPLIVTWIAVIPLFKNMNNYKHFFDLPTILLSGTLILQMAASSYVPQGSHTYTDIFVFTIASLMWRCLFGIPLCILQKPTEEIPEKMSFKHFSGFLFVRSVFSLLTQLTFMWCILEGQPLIFWPILNMTPLVSSVASHFLLNESIKRAEGFALLGFCLAATLPFCL